MPPLEGVVGTGLDILNLGALGFIAYYFASGRAFSSRQVDRMLEQSDKAHRAEVDNLSAYHVTIVGAKDTAYLEMKQSRETERARADDATAALGEMVDALKLNTHVIASFSEAARGESS